ncbi:hypothetical protein H4R99_000134 [Coemansia sp. RSA 1722]|nr:hypothetical protein IWW45_002499 [Coemansia sp. RSA 485]KAJ2602829.1 hypothetical protein GGF39_000523 [Coemansia sp. RSA 1721]KAJ2606708.1 hypothetical protein H4R99_000134 [Coemansia sp. RSA 1722]KAJ2639831.1 hypothetical protein GGF40_000513 [Coemansia sp. RSA 1286]
MSSIASIISFDSAVDQPASAVAAATISSSANGSSYTRASSATSFAYSDEHSLMPTPAPSEGMERLLSEEAESAYAAVHSERASPVSSTSTLPSAASTAAAAVTAAADANRRRKVLTSRPPNSFILYRSDKLRELVQKHPELKQTQISKMCADNWKNETEEVKELYRRKQQEAKTLFLTEQAMEVERISGGGSGKDVIKRIQPTNTFIRYRTEMKKKLAAQFATMNQKDVSRACGLMWRSEPEHVKMRYRQSYNKEKRDFERLCTTSALEPSREALSALASVIESAKAATAGSGSATRSPVSSDKKRRLSEVCYSAPVSPPQTVSATLPKESEESQSSAKRHRSFHTSSLSVSSISPISSPAGISLPSCASLLSLADRSPNMADTRPSLPHVNTRRSPAYSGVSSMEHPQGSHFSIPHGAFEHQSHHHNAPSYYKKPAYATEFQQRRVYAAPYSHRYSVSHAEFSDREHHKHQMYLPPQPQPHHYHRYQLPSSEYPVPQ